MDEVGSDFWGSSGHTTLLKQCYLEQVAQDSLQMASEYLQGRRLHNLPGQPIPMFSVPHSEKMFPDVRTEPLVFQSVPIASGPVTGHH